jgi:hypothetical protein
MKIRLSGLSDGSYALCREKFDLAGRLLDSPEENKEKLSGILRTLNDNPKGTEILKAERKGDYDEVYNRLTQLSPYSNLELTLDKSPLLNGVKKIQKDWLQYRNEQGINIASMGDLYQNFKLLKKMSEEGTSEDRVLTQEYLRSLRDDFDWPGQKNWLISDTGLTYRGNDLETTIVQHNGSNLAKETTLTVPIYKNKPVEEVLAYQAGFDYLRCLFNTEDDSETITQVLEFVSGKNRKDVRIWTAGWSDPKNRAKTPTRAAGFSYSSNRFLVYGNSDIDSNPGRVRGVDMKSAEQTR